MCFTVSVIVWMKMCPDSQGYIDNVGSMPSGKVKLRQVVWFRHRWIGLRCHISVETFRIAVGLIKDWCA